MKRFTIISTMLFALMLVCGTSFAGNTKKSCPDKNLGTPKTEVLTFVGISEIDTLMFDSSSGNPVPMSEFDDNMYKVFSKMKKGTKISATYQIKQQWTDEGEGECMQINQLKSMKVNK